MAEGLPTIVIQVSADLWAQDVWIIDEVDGLPQVLICEYRTHRTAPPTSGPHVFIQRGELARWLDLWPTPLGDIDDDPLWERRTCPHCGAEYARGHLHVCNARDRDPRRHASGSGS
ncbi:MAG: hypothetical protein ACRDHF_00540 [Tepidiformaceae bacterium]